MRASVFISSIIFLLHGCASELSPLPKTESERLNKLIATGHSSYVKFHNTPFDTLYAQQDHILGDSRVDSLRFSARLGRIAGLVKVGDSLYVADGKQNCIWVIDGQGRVCRQVGSQGRGPGEFGKLSGLIRSDNFIFTTDILNARVQKFNLNFRLQDSFNRVIYGTSLKGSQKITATDSLLYLSAGLHNAVENLITVHQSVSPFDSLTSFLPRLIPKGMQPGAYNGYSIDTNRKGNIAVTYTGLSYIFVYDSSHQLQHVVYVNFPKEELPENSPIEPVDKQANTASEAIGVKGLIGKPYLSNNGSLYFSRGGKLYYLRYFPDKNRYRPEWIKFFTYADPEIRKDKPDGIAISNFVIDEDSSNIYFGSLFEEDIYRFSLD